MSFIFLVLETKGSTTATAFFCVFSAVVEVWTWILRSVFSSCAVNMSDGGFYNFFDSQSGINWSHYVNTLTFDYDFRRHGPVSPLLHTVGVLKAVWLNFLALNGFFAFYGVFHLIMYLDERILKNFELRDFQLLRIWHFCSRLFSVWRFVSLIRSLVSYWNFFIRLRFPVDACCVCRSLLCTKNPIIGSMQLVFGSNVSDCRNLPRVPQKSSVVVAWACWIIRGFSTGTKV